MRISAKSEYGILALLYLTCKGQGHPVTVQTISTELGIPKRFLEQIVGDLKRGGLIRSTRGAQGGYTLTRDPREIKLGEVFEVTEGPFDAESHDLLCDFENLHAVRSVWKEIRESIYRVLNGITLKEMCNRTLEMKQRRQLLTTVSSKN